MIQQFRNFFLKFFSLPLPFVHTHLPECVSCGEKKLLQQFLQQQSNAVSRGQKVGVGNLGDGQIIKLTGRRGREKEEEIEERQDAGSTLIRAAPLHNRGGP